MSNENQSIRSGFIGIIGVPNTGKSTLLNKLLDQKIAITSSKPQTTRNRILGIKNTRNAQLIFIDTPGIHKSTKNLNQRIVHTALSTLQEVNAVIWVVDSTKPFNEANTLIIENLNKFTVPTVLALNKIDLIPKHKLLPLIDWYRNLHEFVAITPLSALLGDGLDILLEDIVHLVPEGPRFFPEDMITDLSERFIVAELVREKVLRLCHEEVPHAVAVVVQSFEEKPKKNVIVIHAVIQVERVSQKGILIGKNGAMLKKIGRQAREDIEGILGVKVYLELFVRVAKNWRQDERMLRELGF